MKAEKAAQDAYAEWLRALFKDLTFTPEVVAGAYVTGILPIKKYNHQSAVSDFREYTMVAPVAYAPYVGFTEDEVEGLCSPRSSWSSSGTSPQTPPSTRLTSNTTPR